MPFLVFQLVAPLAAWGDVAVGQTRGSRDAPGESALVGLLGRHDPQGVVEVPDPYYSEGLALFEQVHAQVERCCRAFLAEHDRAGR